jgi:glycosyltransferase involved in cell wall biosynthesis
MGTRNKEMISVCMATYNGEKYIKEQLDSILCQLSESDEVIISDDDSTDTTIEIIQKYNDTRIKLYSNTNRKGVIGNFENTLRKAQGDFLFLSDQDDVWVLSKVEKCVALLKDFDLIVSDCYVTDSELNVIHPSFFAMRGSKSGFLRNLWKNTYLGACVAFRSSLLDYVLPIPKTLPVYHEGWIASLADIIGHVCFFPEQLIYYRRHERNVSNTAKKSPFSVSKKISYRIHLLILIILRLAKIQVLRCK